MINPIGGSARTPQTFGTTAKSGAKKEDSGLGNGVTVEISGKKPNSPTYSKPASVKPNAKEIDRLWKEAERSTASFRQLVNDLIARQGKKAIDVIEGKEVLEVDAQAREEAQQLISPDGELGVEKTSQRIVDFAKALSGGDKSKIPELREAIKQGFDEASRMLGGLPEISQQTYDSVMSKLDEWEKE